MRRWVRAQVDTSCGYTEGCRIDAGEPMFSIHGEAGWTKQRCRHHAGEPVNEKQLAEDDARHAKATAGKTVAAQPTTWSSAKTLATQVPHDGKAAAAGEDS